MKKTEKLEIPLVVYTSTHRMEGTYFNIPEGRLLDDLNGRGAMDFIPMRKVRVSPLTDPDRAEFWDFVALNRHQITFVHTPEPA